MQPEIDQAAPVDTGLAAFLMLLRFHGIGADAEQLRHRFAKGIIGHHMNEAAARKVYQQSGLGPEDFQVIELHDCFSANELLLYEALGLCGAGEAPKLIDDGDTTYGGRWVVNPSGGLISKVHPLGATGLAQCAELNWQLRGEAYKRQVSDVTAALQHNIGLGGAAVVTAYQRADRNN